MDPQSIPPPLLEKLRQSFHDTVTPKLEPDPTFAGPGHVYGLEADLLDTINDAIRSAAGEEDDYFEDLEPLDVFSQLADGTDHSLVSFETSDGWGYPWGYGIDSAQVLDRGYLYLPGEPLEVPWSLVAVWEPAATREAFEHAFMTNYVECASKPWSQTPPFAPNAGDEEVTITWVDVTRPLLAEAMKRSLEVDANAWWKVWTEINPSSLPTAERVATIMAIPEAASGAVIKAIYDDDQAFKEAIAEAPNDVSRAVGSTPTNSSRFAGRERVLPASYPGSENLHDTRAPWCLLPG